MVEYRVFEIDAEGHVAGPSHVIQSEGDDEALIVARLRIKQRTLEIWHGQRRVGTITPGQ